MTEADLERFRQWEAKLVYEWKLPEPPPGWRETLRLRDEAGVTKYPPNDLN